MVCPNCGEMLEPVENEYGLHWVCGKCGGRAVKVSMLRRTLVRQCVNRLWQLARSGKGERKRRCPACRASMVEVAPLSSSPDLLLDVCRPCQLVWFDPQEFSKVPHAPPPLEAVERAADKLPPEAREALRALELERRLQRAAERAEPAQQGGFLSDEMWMFLRAFFGLPLDR